jgi:hypothetical protein
MPMDTYLRLLIFEEDRSDGMLIDMATASTPSVDDMIHPRFHVAPVVCDDGV